MGQVSRAKNERRVPSRRTLPVASGLGRPDARLTLWPREVERFLRWKREETSVGEEWIARMRWELLRLPDLVKRTDPPGVLRQASEVTPELIAHLRRSLPWERATFAIHFAVWRPFLKWAGNPVSERPSIWSLPSGEPTHRRWLTKDQFVRLYRGSSGRGRLLVGLEGLNGLRRIEVLRLRVKDVALDEGCLRVLGKGKDGGKWRKIPIHPSLVPALQVAIQGRVETERLLPLSRTGADALLARAASDAGFVRSTLRISHHDLRRTFGRLAHEAGMDLIQLKNLYGHSSVEMTVHYIGLDSDRMRTGLERLGRLVAV